MKLRNNQLVRALCMGALMLPAVSVACSEDPEGEGEGGSAGAVTTGGAGGDGGPDAEAGHAAVTVGGAGTIGGVTASGGSDEPAGTAGTPSAAGGGAGGEAGSAEAGQPGSVCIATGSACLLTMHCAAGTYCANSQCEVAPAPGAPCIEGRCAAGATCSDGVCIAPTVIPEGDACEYCPGCVCEGDLECHYTSSDYYTEYCVPKLAKLYGECWDRKCEEGSYCQGSFEYDVPATCVPNAGFDGFCGDKWNRSLPATLGCQPGLVCDADVCIYESGEGEECSRHPGTQQCASGLYCLVQGQDELGTCQPAKIGTPCGKGSICQDGSYCSDGVCHERAGLGENCEHTPCEQGARCNDPAYCQWYASCDLPPYVCLREASPGKSCDDATCSAGHFCMPTGPG